MAKKVTEAEVEVVNEVLIPVEEAEEAKEAVTEISHREVEVVKEITTRVNGKLQTA